VNQISDHNKKNQTNTHIKNMFQLNIVGKAPVIRQISFDSKNNAESNSTLSHTDIPMNHHSTVITNIVPLKQLSNNHFLLSSYDKTCSIVNQSSNGVFERVVQFKAHNEEVMCCTEMASTGDNGRIITGGFDGCFKIWNTQKLLSATQQGGETENPEISGTFVNDAQPEETVQMEDENLACFKLKADRVNQRLFVLSADSSIRVFDVKNNAVMTHKLQGHSDRVRDIHYNSHSSTLISVGDDRRVQLWDLRNNRLIHTFLGTSKQTMCVTSCGERIVVGGVLGDMKVFDLRSLPSDSSSPTSSVTAALEIEEAHEKVVSCLYAVNASTCASLGGNDGCVKLWNVNDGSCLATCSVGDVMLDMCSQKMQ